MTQLVPTLTTERLTLRAPKPQDWDGYRAIMTSDRAKYMDGPYSAKEAWADFAATAGSWIVAGYGGWTIADRTNDAFLGTVAITRPPHFPETEIGWLVSPAAEGNGYAYEAAQSALHWAFAERGLETLVSYIDPPNARSIRLAERLGAQRDEAADAPSVGDLVYRHAAKGAMQ